MHTDRDCPVLLQTTFTYIGLGGDSPWGMLLVGGRDWILSPGGILTYWWVFVPPALALILFGIAWSLLGEHNQLNALAAIAAAEHVGVAAEGAGAALAGFVNVRRRLELRGEAAGVKVYDDFAHHPTAMRVTVGGLRRRLDQNATAPGAPRPRILAVFEPRSNTMKLGTMKAQLPWALEEAALVFGLQGDYGWSVREALAPLGPSALVADSVDTLVVAIVRAVQPGDHVLCMSNGGFGGIHGKLLEALKAHRP